MVIFTTAYSEYAVEGFSSMPWITCSSRSASLTSAVRPPRPTRFTNCGTTSARRPRPRSPEAEAETPDRGKEFLFGKADYKVSLVKIREIVYLESEGEYVRMHLADGSTITTLFRLKNMEAELPADSFMRIHRSYIVNLRRIKSFVKGRVFLSDTDCVPIGENYAMRHSSNTSTARSGTFSRGAAGSSRCGICPVRRNLPALRGAVSGKRPESARAEVFGSEPGKSAPTPHSPLRASRRSSGA